MNNRRKLVIALGAGAFTAPFASFARWAEGKYERGINIPNSILLRADKVTE